MTQLIVKYLGVFALQTSFIKLHWFYIMHIDDIHSSLNKLHSVKLSPKYWFISFQNFPKLSVICIYIHVFIFLCMVCFQLLGFCVACYVIYVFTEEDDSCKYYYESFHCDTLLTGSDHAITPTALPVPSNVDHRGGRPYVQRRLHYSEADPLARSSFISLQERWSQPTYVSFQEGCDTWAGQASTKLWAHRCLLLSLLLLLVALYAMLSHLLKHLNN